MIGNRYPSPGFGVPEHVMAAFDVMKNKPRFAQSLNVPFGDDGNPSPLGEGKVGEMVAGDRWQAKVTA